MIKPKRKLHLRITYLCKYVFRYVTEWRIEIALTRPERTHLNENYVAAFYRDNMYLIEKSLRSDDEKCSFHV